MASGTKLHRSVIRTIQAQFKEAITGGAHSLGLSESQTESLVTRLDANWLATLIPSTLGGASQVVRDALAQRCVFAPHLIPPPPSAEAYIASRLGAQPRQGSDEGPKEYIQRVTALMSSGQDGLGPSRPPGVIARRSDRQLQRLLQLPAPQQAGTTPP